MTIRKKSAHLILTCALTMITANAVKAETSICEEPITKICTQTKDQRDAREVVVKKMKQEIADEANKNAAPRIAEMKKKISSIHFIKRMIQTYKINNQEVMKSAKVRVGDLEKVITSPENIAKLKSYMLQAIDDSHYDISTKNSFKEIISSIVIGNFADFLEKSGLEDNVLAQLLGNACGSDGLIDNAFATTLNNQRYVLVCPGFLITLSNEANEREKFDSILQAISHEMGHHIDSSKVGNELYQPYYNCLAKNYAGTFNKTKEDEKFCKANEKEPAKCAAKVVLSHAGELVADQWGIKVTAIHSRLQQYSVSDSETMLTQSWAKLCGTGDEGIHPTGDFRIGTLLKKNPSIVEILGCASSKTDLRPACDLSGEVVAN
jgi:hypothetical protein